MGLIFVKEEVENYFISLQNYLDECESKLKNNFIIVQALQGNMKLESATWNKFFNKIDEIHRYIFFLFIMFKKYIEETYQKISAYELQIEKDRSIKVLNEDVLTNIKEQLLEDNKIIDIRIAELGKCAASGIDGIFDFAFQAYRECIEEMQRIKLQNEQIIRDLEDKIDCLYELEKFSRNVIVETEGWLSAMRIAIHDGNVLITGNGNMSSGEWKTVLKLTNVEEENDRILKLYLEMLGTDDMSNVENYMFKKYVEDLYNGKITPYELKSAYQIIQRKYPNECDELNGYKRDMLNDNNEKLKGIISSYDFAYKIVDINHFKKLEWAYITEEHMSELRLTLIKYDINSLEKYRHFIAQCDVETANSKDLIENRKNKYGGGGRIQVTSDYTYYAFAIYSACTEYPELEKEIGSLDEYTPEHHCFADIKDKYELLCDLTGANELMGEKGKDVSESVNPKINANIKPYTDIVNIGASYVAENYAWDSAGFFWMIRGCNEKVESFKNDSGENVDEITAIVNNGSNDYEKRRKAYEKVKRIIF